MSDSKIDSKLVISDYLHNMLNVENLHKTVDKCSKVLMKYDFDAIAFRGMSGALISIPLALKMNKPLIMVRKPKDGSHSYLKVEGAINAKTYIIADDFIASGQTARTIVEKIGPKSKCLGVLTADRLGDDWRSFELLEVPIRQPHWKVEEE